VYLNLKHLVLNNLLLNLLLHKLHKLLKVA
jgi:hypothetical protein